MARLREKYQGLKSDLVKVKSSLSLAGALTKFFRERVKLKRAEEESKGFLIAGPKDFLTWSAHGFTKLRQSYCRLLKHARCDSPIFRQESCSLPSQVSVHSALITNLFLSDAVTASSNLSRPSCLELSNLPRVIAAAAVLFQSVHATQKLNADFRRILVRTRSRS